MSEAALRYVSCTYEKEMTLSHDYIRDHNTGAARSLQSEMEVTVRAMDTVTQVRHTACAGERIYAGDLDHYRELRGPTRNTYNKA